MALLSLQPSVAGPDRHEVAAHTQHIRDLHLMLRKPAQYDTDGHGLHHWCRILPSAPLSCLAPLSDDVKRRQALRDDLESPAELLGETVYQSQIACLGRMHATQPSVSFA